MNSLGKYSGYAYALMRIIVGLLFACHGGQKILGFPPGGHGAPMDALGLVGAWIELAGGFLVAFGLLTRVAAFITSGEMAVAYFLAHAKGGFFPIQNHGESAVFYCFVFFYIFFRGAGLFSLDSLIFRAQAAGVGEVGGSGRIGLDLS
ncbi:MAG: DoxX family protein [Chthoniobacterales bacterium]